MIFGMLGAGRTGRGETGTLRGADGVTEVGDEGTTTPPRLEVSKDNKDDKNKLIKS